MTGPSDVLPAPLMARIRQICLDLPEVTETSQFHGTHPVFQAGKKTFVYIGERTIGVKTEPGQAEALLADPRFQRMAYIGQHGWVRLTLSSLAVKDQDWDEIEDLLVTSYRQVALKRMLKQLDARGDA